MNQLKTFASIVFVLLAVGLGFVLAGWWMLVPIVLGVLWQVAGLMSQRPGASQHTHDPRYRSSTPSKPASTQTWQETVEAIERSRSQG